MKRKNSNELVLRLSRVDDDGNLVEEWDRDLVPSNPILLTESEMEEFSHFEIRDNNDQIVFAYFPGE